MVYVKGQPADFDGLASMAGDDWSWQHIARAYEEMESHALGAGEGRGASGPLHVTVPEARTPLTEAIASAGEAVGWPRKADVHQPDDGEGIGYVPRNVWKGRRQSASVAFLRPAMKRRNLTVITDATADVVRFAGKRAVGMDYLRRGQRKSVDARREVILCASAVASPSILERSGIGDPDRLARLGIPLVHANPAVGEGVSEHRGMYLQWRLNQPVSENLDYRGLRLLRSVLRYYLTRTGPMATAALEMRAAFRSRPGLNRPDTQALFGMYSAELTTAMGKLPERDHGFCVLIYPLRPKSTGSVHIDTRDPAAPPVINANYGSHEEDRRVIVDAVRQIRRFAAQEPLAGLIASEMHPGPACASDTEILSYLDSNGMACLHAVGSCRMGRDAESVVDPELRVRGVEGLRVMDTSVMPVIPAGNTNAPTMAMAWRAAEVIRRG
jgi:choline dehydrogenase-like flavoprotein